MAASSHHSQRQQPSHAPANLVLADRPWFRRLIGAFLVGHIIAVAVAPLSVLVGGFPTRAEPPGGGPPRPAVDSDEGQDRPVTRDRPQADRHLPAILRFANLIQPYLDVLNLNHGYSFFAPEPGPSFLIEYEIEREDGRIVRGRLPDLDRHWPRLLYHRYFMLATQNPGLVADAEARGKVSPRSTRTLAFAIAKHLHELHQGRRTVLRLLQHRLLWPEEVLQGKDPDSPDTYQIDGEIRYPEDSVTSLVPPTGTAPDAEELDP